MKFSFTLITSLILLAVTNAHAFQGSYACDDGSTLTLTSVEPTFYLANKINADKSASSLAVISFDSTLAFGEMYRDDEEAYMGDVKVTAEGLSLQFENGNTVLCHK
ncbi:hypothetical protein B9G69_012595 [Bdellovibrio sp. SKB1291214]|uniref:hypothetical protein n=1 Tax=Bdellovibrio sp. SKB1291214 TaxID=1732569 RepID=UPI000B51799B|nr:hypothetical protein [Bdellovibrio sp. SKB1291214]UYL07885.1 hypothetical protein B9G69_012595 [Bdellovibrio sp. SKB1291214]